MSSFLFGKMNLSEEDSENTGDDGHRQEGRQEAPAETEYRASIAVTQVCAHHIQNCEPKKPQFSYCPKNIGRVSWLEWRANGGSTGDACIEKGHSSLYIGESAIAIR
jgi:hypothetical protein